MLSVLIPTYNHSVTNLVQTLLRQLEESGYVFEVLICDDASTAAEIQQENNPLNKETGVQLFVNTENKGRTATRQFLAETSKYDTLLFLDADVMPVSNTFISKFLKHSTETDLIFGGIAYTETKPENDDLLLHWAYGRNREAQTVAQRQKTPYLSVNSGCICIQKPVFLHINAQMTTNAYGLDNYFKQLLKAAEISVKHSDNPVYHTGLETTEAFIGKMLKSVETTITLEQDNLMRDDVRPLQRIYKRLKSFHAVVMFQSVYKLLEDSIMKNLYSEKPSLRYFDMLRLNHYINLKS